jgi:hypothetical protein
MKTLLRGVVITMMAGSAAYAQNPAPPEPHTPPTANQTAPAPAPPDTKTLTAPEAAAPIGAGFVPDQSWIGRYVYSNDGKELGKIVAVNPITPSEDIYFDTGGFLGIGTTRKYVATEHVRDVQSDRIVLNLSTAEADDLPEEE